MSNLDIRHVVEQELANIAPEIDVTKVAGSVDLREALDIDSMDFLTFVTAIHRRLEVDIPEIDYPKFVTIDGAVAYLIAHLNRPKG
jgi:acyl carrier protein